MLLLNSLEVPALAASLCLQIGLLHLITCVAHFLACPHMSETVSGNSS